MDSAFVLPSKLRLFLACLVVSTLSACAISPGNTSFSGREQSDVKLPVQKGEEIVPENVKVKPITAELIIEMFNAARPSRAVGSTANAQPAKASQIDPATQALNYKLGPATSFPSSSGITPN
jgi:polysaccharide export outer membrane protein